MIATVTLPELAGLASMALVLGMRHGVDADHLAAIDAMTRCNAVARPGLARRTGIWFSLVSSDMRKIEGPKCGKVKRNGRLRAGLALCFVFGSFETSCFATSVCSSAEPCEVLA